MTESTRVGPRGDYVTDCHDLYMVFEYNAIHYSLVYGPKSMGAV